MASFKFFLTDGPNPAVRFLRKGRVMCRAASFADQISSKLFGSPGTVPGPFGMEVAAHVALRSFGLLQEGESDN